jgi:hypothetical protein
MGVRIPHGLRKVVHIVIIIIIIIIIIIKDVAISGDRNVRRF